jgi:hypothetical protein
MQPLTPYPTIPQDRVARLAAKVLLMALRRQWVLAPWSPPFSVHAHAPQPGDAEGYVVDPVTGLGVGWDGTISGYFLTKQHKPAGVICAWWGSRYQPAPGACGFHEWILDERRDLLGVMLAPQFELGRLQLSGPSGLTA